MLVHTDADAREMAVRAMAAVATRADCVAVASRLVDVENDVRSAACDTLVSLRDVIQADAIDAIAKHLRYELYEKETRYASNLHTLVQLARLVAADKDSDKVGASCCACGLGW